MPPSLGVLITYHNEGPLLSKCLDTLLSGSDKPDEVLIYDDASHDPAQHYVKDHHLVRIIRGEKNIGIGLARNELMRLSQSEYVHFHDADDYFKPEWCERVRGQMATGEADIIFNSIFGINLNNQNLWNQKLFPFDQLQPDGDLIHFFLGIGHYVVVSMVTFRRRLGLEIGGFLPREILDVSEDFEFYLRLFSLGLKHRTINEPLAIKGNHPGSLSYDDQFRLRPEIRVSRLKASRLLLKWLPENYYSSMARFLLNASLPHFNNHEIREATECYDLVVSLTVSAGTKELADLYHKNGAEFLRIGDIARARQAFKYAEHFGPVPYRNYSKPYRSLARLLGPEPTERVVQLYRKIIPKKWRRRARRILS